MYGMCIMYKEKNKVSFKREVEIYLQKNYFTFFFNMYKTLFTIAIKKFKCASRARVVQQKANNLCHKRNVSFYTALVAHARGLYKI